MNRARSVFVATLVAGCRPAPAQPLTPNEPPSPGRSSAHRAPTDAGPAPTATSPEDPVAAAVAGPERCNPLVAAPERREGDLLVLAPPAEPRDPQFRGRLRTHTEGPLTKGSPRQWVGPQVPGFMPLTQGTAELHLLERDGDDFVGIYRDPYGASSCGLSSPDNCEVWAVAFDRCGEERWARRLNDVMSRPTHLEIQDVRVRDGMLYFNEACQSYSKEAGGRCSSLIAFDPVAATVEWRTKPLVSNNRFLVLDDYIVAGYGFTSEPDHLFVVRRSDGEVVARRKIPSAHEDLSLDDDGGLVVQIYPGRQLRFELRGLTTDRPSFVPRR